ncbi:calpain-7 isoform X2 [Manis pentadactyla]|uniref:calpain-7 isoform X2 n=1 Tax=Manis pentadactyla TaxID=143292 RepID=UPI00255CCD9D|nr:calpain-7 isoform X2 [Manis pentadactyla]
MRPPPSCSAPALRLRTPESPASAGATSDMPEARLRLRAAPVGGAGECWAGEVRWPCSSAAGGFEGARPATGAAEKARCPLSAVGSELCAPAAALPSPRPGPRRAAGGRGLWVWAFLPPCGFGAMDATALERDAVQFARLAVQRDHEGRYSEAVFYYKEAAQALIYAEMAGSSLEHIQEKINEYLERVQALHSAVQSKSADPLKSKHQLDLERARFLVTQAFDEDEKGNIEDAIELYTEAVDLCLKTSYETADKTLQNKLKQLARQALDRTTSKINGIEYVPFMSIDLRERFAYPMPFCDRWGKLPLSPKQKATFSKWVRPEDLASNPAMIYTVSSFSIKQTIVSDCSFVASLAISAAYERRFNKKLITSIIYPQNKDGEPEYNPCGKYMVKLHLNGVPRKVIIDDQLPVDHKGELLCSYSNNKSELWVSLIEKAYMKVMGGYDFPGSNSNIDLHALTGWIPERIAMHSDSQTFSKDNSFRMLYQRFHKGDVLITASTGTMTEAEGEKWGLVPTHAYAVLDIREFKGLRFIQLKNPWSHLRWKGRYNENDVKNWTPELQKYLNFDPRTAQKIDNGIFWISWDDLCQYYDVMYLSWNPGLFKESTCIHSTWDAKQGPVKDAYSLANNPQYKLEVHCPQGGAAVWVLLSRHITDKDDFANNREFITMVVYKTDGKKVYYPGDPPPYIDGIRINSPHYLTKMKLTTPGTHTFTLVVSQYEKQNTIHYTVRVYSACSFTFSKIPSPYTLSKQINGKWSGQSAGGCANFQETHKNNPIYQFHMEKPGPLLIELRGPRQYSVGFEIVIVSMVGDPGPHGFQRKSSGDYRCGFCYLELENIPAGIYNIIPSTFLPKQEGPFFLDFNSIIPIKTTQLQ